MVGLVMDSVPGSFVFQRSAEHWRQQVGRWKRLFVPQTVRLPVNQLVQKLRPLSQPRPVQGMKRLLEPQPVPRVERSMLMAPLAPLGRHSFEVSPAPLAHSQQVVGHLLVTVGWE